jgi:hypothetical protein
VERQQKERYGRKSSRASTVAAQLSLRAAATAETLALCVFGFLVHTEPLALCTRSLFTFNLITEAKERSKGSQGKTRRRQLECFPLLPNAAIAGLR